MMQKVFQFNIDLICFANWRRLNLNGVSDWKQCTIVMIILKKIILNFDMKLNKFQLSQHPQYTKGREKRNRFLLSVWQKFKQTRFVSRGGNVLQSINVNCQMSIFGFWISQIKKKNILYFIIKQCKCRCSMFGIQLLSLAGQNHNI